MLHKDVCNGRVAKPVIFTNGQPWQIVRILISRGARAYMMSESQNAHQQSESHAVGRYECILEFISQPPCQVFINFTMGACSFN